MFRLFLRPLTRAFPRLRRFGTNSRQFKEEGRYNPNLLLPQITGYDSVNASYRCLPPTDPIIEALHDVLATIVWTWLFYNLYHHHAILHEYHPPPDPEKWTDEELGLPPEE